MSNRSLLFICVVLLLGILTTLVSQSVREPAGRRIDNTNIHEVIDRIQNQIEQQANG